MSTYYGPQLPLSLDDDTGVSLLKTRVDAIKQDLLNLLLTEPGERPRYPDFGAGLKKLLFQKNINEVKSASVSRIRKQISSWMPYVKIDNISFSDLDPTAIAIHIDYFIPVLGTRDNITITPEIIGL